MRTEPGGAEHHARTGPARHDRHRLRRPRTAGRVLYQPPAWPSQNKQAHLDFHVADLDQAVTQLLALGATRPEFQPGDGQWVVLADPQGHLLCLAAGD
ncbi:VOC family protein [Amycolatopsis lurida]